MLKNLIGHLTDAQRGFLLGLGAFVIWTFSDTANKLASEHGSTPFVAMWVCAFINSCFFVLRSGVKRNFGKLVPKKKLPVVMRGLANCFLGFFIYTAYRALPLTDVYMCEFTTPFFIALGASILLKEKLSRRSIISILVGFFGVFIAINPQFLLSDMTRAYGYGAAMLGAVFFAISQLFTKYLAGTEEPEAIMFTPNALCILLGVVLPLPFGQLQLIGWWYLIVQAAFGLSGAYMMIAASGLAKASDIAPLQYAQFLMATIIGLIIWQTTPSLGLWIGSAIVIVAGLLLTGKFEFKKHV